MEKYNGTFSIILSGNLEPIEIPDALFNNNKNVNEIEKKSISKTIELKPLKEKKSKPKFNITNEKVEIINKIVEKIDSDVNIFQVGIYEEYLSLLLSKKAKLLNILLDIDIKDKEGLDLLSSKDNVTIYIGEPIFSLDNFYIFNNQTFDYIIIDDYRNDTFVFIKIMQDIKKIVNKKHEIISIGNVNILKNYDINIKEKIEINEIVVTIFTFK